MVSQKTIVKNEQGLHMRPAGAFVKLASKYKCNIMNSTIYNPYNVDYDYNPKYGLSQRYFSYRNRYKNAVV